MHGRRSRGLRAHARPSRALPPPLFSRGALAWARANLFSSLSSALLTLAAARAGALVRCRRWSSGRRCRRSGRRPTARCAARIRTAPAGRSSPRRSIISATAPIRVTERWRVDLTESDRRRADRLAALARRAAARHRRRPVLPRLPDRRLRPAATAAESLGLPLVDTLLWGGVFVSLLTALVGIVFSLPLGVLLALGRRSHLPIVQARERCLHRIRARRAVHHRAVHGQQHAAAVPAGGLGARPFPAPARRHRRCSPPPIWPRRCAAACSRSTRANTKARWRSGCNYWRMMRPRRAAAGADAGHSRHRQQFHRPVQGYDAGRRSSASTTSSRRWTMRSRIRSGAARRSQPTGYAFAALFYFVFCYAMSRYSAGMERRLRQGRAALKGADDDAGSNAIEFVGVHKWYGSFHVLRNIDLDGAARRADRRLRPVGLRQVDADPLRQPAGGASARHDPRRRHRTDRPT